MSRAMKDSGIPWIGEMPEGWNCARMKQIGKYVNGYAFKPEDWGNSGKPIIRIQDLTGSNNSPNYYEGDIDEKYLIKNGDILVSWAATLDAFIWGKGEGWLNQHIFKAIPNTSIQKDFFFWLLKVAMSHMNNDNKHGIVMQHLTLNVFGNFIIPIPPLAEQQRIAEFLDRKCAEVDEMIALQEQIIEELKAYKQSVITEAVTKGLNPDVPMKDSGIEWIGEIPEHWRIGKIKMIAKTNSGSTPKTISQTEESSIVWIRTTDINDNLVTDSSLHLTQEELNSASCPMLNKDVCVVAMYGGGGTIGKCGILGVEATINQALCSIEVKSFHLGAFMFWTLRATRYNWMKFAVGTRKDPNISQEIVRNYIVPIPPIEEQQKISDYLNTKCTEIGNLISIKQSKIDSLKEYKKSIIYEYVTGKREVE